MAVSVRRAPANSPREMPPPIPKISAVTTSARQRALSSALHRNQTMPTLAYLPLSATVTTCIYIIHARCGPIAKGVTRPPPGVPARNAGAQARNRLPATPSSRRDYRQLVWQAEVVGNVGAEQYLEHLLS